MNKLALDELLRRALNEDLGLGDITSEAIFGEEHVSRGYLLAKEKIVLAGIGVFAAVFALLDERVRVIPHFADGNRVNGGERIALLEGPTRALLAGERVALNLLQHMSGIATETSRYVEALQGSGTVIVDTRKTTPGLRMLEKYAVTMGGGKNHRYGLDGMVMIKDNHIQAAGGILPAVEKVRRHVSPFVKIEVETEKPEQILEALAAGVDVIMLDNMPLAAIQQAVKMVDGRALIEVSGNVTLEKVAALGIAGVDVISSGALTHSVKAADISMKLE
ncbi:aldolase-type tim barrel [Lucifera butyrica]|uniref:Probable nicotinate-nucleotide pyrophosphorylase [carboxylating] n=1 Tax=Lucifera butyrica TaxID=1351585 RepID=A0A498R5L4_9FIRM|nr:carboxylating nicotinate-nucleotide diphosphorylase [Lucifera butyrica]VBB06744.1 aldolase-type tim barrel [Lucifera butyrica]